MARKTLSSQLSRLLLIRGVSRAVIPLAVLWGMYDWYCIRPLYALIFAILTANYLIVYVLVWVAPHLLNGPWRVRPWQTFILLANIFVLPITFYRHFTNLPWGFMAFQLVMLAALVISTKIFFYLQERLPMASLFAVKRGGMISSAPAPQPSTSNTPDQST